MMLGQRASHRLLLRIFTVFLTIAGFLISAPAGAAYPDRPIKMIVPWAAGGDTDAIMRVIGNSLEKQLGKPVVIVNITGASATLGAREAKKAPPDGYTILALHDFIHTTYHTGVAEMTYKDFEPVSLMTSTPSILGAYAKTPWNNLKELLDDARKRPEQITVGATMGGTAHFFPAMVAHATGVKWRYVSYEGTAPRMTALLGGHVLLGDTNLTQLDKVRAGQIKMLAVATPKRLQEIGDVPTFKELGFDVIYSVNRGIATPRGTPDAILARLEEAAGKATKDPAVIESMKKQGTFIEYLNRKGYADFLAKQDKMNAELAQALGFKRR
jgi:tripartite-type tricarboxylate transporter receptor subunit TctC